VVHAALQLRLGKKAITVTTALLNLVS